MATIQEVGKAILSNTPDKLYIFGGHEYGLKCKYIDMMKEHYGSAVEAESAESVFKLMQGRRIVPLSPALYIVRYDEEFVRNLNEKQAEQLEKLNIVGTIVCLYEDEKQVQKCMKFLTKYTVRIDPVNPAYVVQYLIKDYPSLSQLVIQNVVSVTSDYNLCRCICNCLQYASPQYLSKATPAAIANAFGYKVSSTEDNIKLALAARDFNCLVTLLDHYEDDLGLLLYTVMSTMLTLEKLIGTKYGDDPLRQYVSLWNVTDIYFMFNNAFLLLQQSRKYAVNMKDQITYLFSLVRVSPVPNLEVWANEVS